jgi:SAM-dependent methyltransferase
MPDTARTPYVDPELYDLSYSWYSPDLEFYLGLAKASRGPVLEVGCGTGRVLIPMLQAGVDADGLDLEPAMLARLESKAQALGLAPRVFAGDMRDFTMPRRYRLIVLPFRPFQHLLSTEDQLRALRCLREHLLPGGAMVMNLFYPSWDYIAENAGKTRVTRTFPHPVHGRTVAFHEHNEYDRVNQVVTVERVVVEEGEPGGEPVRTRVTFALRWVFRFEMELLLRAAGFTRYDLRRGFDGGPFEKDTDEMVWSAWRD